MRFRMSWKIALIVLALLAILMAWFVYHRLTPFISDLDTVLANQLTTELKRAVTIESATVISRNRVVITGLRVADGRSFNQGTLFTARRITADLDLTRIATGRGSVASNMRGVTIVEPSLSLVRNQGGVLNVKDLLERPQVPLARRFKGIIRVESGQLTMTDRASLLSKGPAVNTIIAIRGTIDYRTGDVAQVDLEGRGKQSRIGRLTLRGPLAASNPMLTKLDVTVAGANAGYWLDYFSTTIPSWSIRDGMLNGSGLIYRTDRGKYTAKGTGTIRDGSLTSPHLAIPLRQVAADVSFVGTAIRLRADARLRGSPIHAVGTIVAGGALNLRVTSNRMDALTLQRAVVSLPTIPRSLWPAPLSFDALVFGSTTKPQVHATASIPRAVISGLSASGITATGDYSAGVITISDLRARVPQGDGRFSAVVNLKTHRTTINGTLRTAGGTIRTSGSVAAVGRLDLAVTASGVDIGALLGPLGYRQATGAADFKGRLTGTISSPVLIGDLTARNGHLQQITFDFLHARLTATRDYLILTNATIRRKGSEIATTGSVRIARGAPAQVDLRATGQRLSLVELQELTGLKIDAQGRVDIDLRVRGRYPNLLAEGTIAVADATISGYQVDSATIDLRTVDGHTVIEQFVVARGDMRLTGSGSIGSRGELSIAVAGKALDLSLLNKSLSPYATLSGQMEFTGDVSGTLSDPRLRGELVSSTPTVNQIQYDRLVASLTWDGTTISLLDVSLTGTDSSHSIKTLQFNTVTKSIVLERGISSARLEAILPLLRNSPYLGTPAGEALKNSLETVPPDASGKVEAVVSLSGPMDGLSGTIEVNGSEIVLGPTQISSLKLGFTGERSSFRFNSLEVVSPGVNLNASTRSDDEPNHLTASITDTQVSALVALVENMPFLPSFGFGQGLVAIAQSVPTPASGLINATVDLTDTRQGGTGSISAQITDLSLSDQAVGTVTASAHLVEGAVSIDQLDISGPLGTAGIQGSVSADNVISLKGRIEGVSLAVLGPLIGMPEVSGALDIVLQVTGTLDDASVQASVTATNVKTSQVAFESITISDLVIAGGKLTASQITAVAGANEIHASASLPFSWEAPFILEDQPIDVRLSALNQDLAELAKFLSFVQSASGTLSLNLAITGTIKDPAITSGGLVVQNGQINIERFDSDVKDLQIDATFEGTTLQIKGFTGASSLGGTFAVTGKVELPSLSSAVIDGTLAMDGLRMSANNLTGVYGERVTMTATGLLNLNESLQAPLIQGDLVVSEAVIRLPEGELPKAGTPGYKGPNPRFDVTLNLASNVRIQRGPLQVVVVGPVSIAGSLSQPDIYGTVALTSGSLRYPGRTFTLVPGGSATFVWQSPEAPNIAIDLQATTRAIAQSPFTGRLTRYRIYIDVSGTIDRPTINTTSSPPGLSDSQALALIFRQAEIEALLSGVDFQQVVEQQLADTLLGLALPGIFEGIELGALTIGLEAGLAVPLQAWVSLQVTDKFSIGYLSTLISGEPFYALEFDYAISPQYAISIQYQQHQEVLYLLQSGWRF